MEIQTDDKEVTEKKLQTDTPSLMDSFVQTNKVEFRNQGEQAGPSSFTDFISVLVQAEQEIQ